MSEERAMKKFQPGEKALVRLVFRSGVLINSIFVVFVHEEDENAELDEWISSRDENKPIKPSRQITIEFELSIEKDTKPGVYTLDKIRFETFSGNTLDYQGDIGPQKFEVVPEREIAPTVTDLSIFTEPEWERLKRNEES